MRCDALRSDRKLRSKPQSRDAGHLRGSGMPLKMPYTYDQWNASFGVSSSGIRYRRSISVQVVLWLQLLLEQMCAHIPTAACHACTVATTAV